MGTRNLTIIFFEGAYRVAQYCQWDGYPSGQGATVLNFLTTPGNIDRLKAGLAHTRLVSEDEIQRKWKECGADDSGRVTLDVSDRMKQRYPTLHRDLGAGVLDIIAAADGRDIPLNPQLEFAADGLFCEWAYVIDLDKNVLEVFKGSSTAPRDPNERFDFLADKCDGEYSYIRLAQSWPLDALPTLDVFVDELELKEVV